MGLALKPGAYGPAIGFTNTTNGRGSTARAARLIVRPLRDYLLDAPGDTLLDDHGEKLLAR
jgi:hypothetical protein